MITCPIYKTLRQSGVPDQAANFLCREAEKMNIDPNLTVQQILNEIERINIKRQKEIKYAQEQEAQNAASGIRHITVKNAAVEVPYFLKTNSSLVKTMRESRLEDKKIEPVELTPQQSQLIKSASVESVMTSEPHPYIKRIQHLIGEGEFI
ncbi:MAG: hypothetical protein M3P08_11240 [Thermoproteota archaeon]|nr:hypothetical protein [Thermoproteota archaeon]